MENKISRILENALARTIFDMTKADINHSYKDYISIELLRENSSMLIGSCHYNLRVGR